MLNSVRDRLFNVRFLGENSDRLNMLYNDPIDSRRIYVVHGRFLNRTLDMALPRYDRTGDTTIRETPGVSGGYPCIGPASPCD